jgi:hypothetical protein
MAKQPKTARARIDGIWAVLNDKRSVSDRLKMERRQTIGIDRHQSCSIAAGSLQQLQLRAAFSVVGDGGRIAAASLDMPMTGSSATGRAAIIAWLTDAPPCHRFRQH